jgi:pyruvate-ferredoxin/flavodoxin oxidoreductase
VLFFVPGTAQGPDVFFQMCELSNSHYDAVPSKIQQVMDLFAKKTGRKYELYRYYGAPDAKHICVVMGSGYFVVKDYVEYAINHAKVDGEDLYIMLALFWC